MKALTFRTRQRAARICSIIASGGFWIDEAGDLPGWWETSPILVALRLGFESADDAARYAYVVMEYVELERTDHCEAWEIAAEAEALLRTGLTQADMEEAAQWRKRRASSDRRVVRRVSTEQKIPVVEAWR